MTAKVKIQMNTKGALRRVLGLLAGLALQVSAMAGTITYYHNDLAGSPVAATNASGQVIWRESYRPYGERTTNSAASTGNDVWFTSRRQDVESGLVYMGARYYDPLTGRFASMDPRGFDESNLHSFNRFVFANNNPYRYVDPDGRDARVIAGGIAALIVGGYTVYLASGPERRKRMEDSLMAGVRQVNNIFNESEKKPSAQSDAADKKSDESGGSDADGDRKVNPTKQDSPVWNELDNAGGGRKRSGTGSGTRFYDWDHRHNDIEVYDQRGRHLGSMDPTSGEMYKPPVPGRKIDP